MDKVIVAKTENEVLTDINKSKVWLKMKLKTCYHYKIAKKSNFKIYKKNQNFKHLTRVLTPQLLYFYLL